MTSRPEIVELAHVVKNLDEAIKHWTQTIGAGPFYVLDVPAMPGQLYRGAPTCVSVRVAFGITGGLTIELIQQTNDTPSVFQEILKTHGDSAHHMKLREPYDGGVARLTAQGYEIAYSGVLHSGGRYCLFDTRSGNGGYIELMDKSPEMEDALAQMRQARSEWDGYSEPVRDLAALFSRTGSPL